MRIIAELHLGHWSARFADEPALMDSGTFGGRDAFDAIRRLLENSSARHLKLTDFEPDLATCRLNRVELVLVDRWDSGGDRCQDCGGTGEYVGLNAVEPCATCGGTGAI